MFSRTAILKSRDASDKERLLNFIRDIRSHSMYEPYLNALYIVPGFIRKETKFVEQPQGTILYSSVIFESREEFNNFYSKEENEFIWNYFEIITNQYGIDFALEDSEI